MKGNPGCASNADGSAWICRGSNNYYVPRIHRTGAKKYEPLKPTTSYRIAVMRIAKEMANDRNHWLNRADVLYCADYYDPIVVLEIKS